MADSTEAPGYSLGWVSHKFLGSRSNSHAGSARTFKARVTIQASHDLAVAVVTNAGHDEPDEATIGLQKALLEWSRGQQKQPSTK